MNSVKVAISGKTYTDKLKGGDTRWSAFNAGFKNAEMQPLEFAEAAWAGHAFTTWHSNQWRNAENYILGQHLGLDFDTEDDNSRIDVLAEQPFIRDNASFLYTTPSHTEEAPRCRVVFTLDQPIHQPRNYVLAATSLIWLFAGMPDSKTTDECRFFYGAGAEPDAAMPANVLTLEKVKKIIGMYQVTGAIERERQEKRQREFKSRASAEGMEVSSDRLLSMALEQAVQGQRNERGLWLACQLRDNGFGQTDAVDVLHQYKDLCPQGAERYTNAEAMASVRSAYSRSPRTAWGKSA